MMIEFDSHTLWVKVKKQEGIGKMKFSLIIGTLNRCRELEICLESLRKQVFRDFEVIIIDQSINDSTQQLANGYQDLNIIYEHVDFMGLSKARNYALKMAHGDYFALIDDDAYYDERYLWEADKVLNDDREMILVGNIVQKSMLKKYSSKKQLKAIGYHQIMKNCPSPVLVFPYTLYCKGICFDENFGVGATFGACEETDLILEALDNKYQMTESSILDVFVSVPFISLMSYTPLSRTLPCRRYAVKFKLKWNNTNLAAFSCYGNSCRRFKRYIACFYVYEFLYPTSRFI